jgi:hypothetical protein
MKTANTIRTRALLSVVGLCGTILFFLPAGQASYSAVSQSHTSESQTSRGWPTLSEIVASDRNWPRLSDLSLSEQEHSEIERIMTPWMRRHCPRVTTDEFERRFAALSSRQIQLSKAGPGQLAVSEVGDWEGDSNSCPCLPSLNCHVWLLDFHSGRATPLLQYSGFGPLVVKSSHDGYFDIVTASFARAEQIELTLWTFSGERYAPARCASVRYPKTAFNGGRPLSDSMEEASTLSPHTCKSSR